jgi:hypothetical protein
MRNALLLKSILKVYIFWLHKVNNICMAVYTHFLQCHLMSLMDFVVSPPGCGRSVTDFWGWDANESQLRCPDEVGVIYDYEVPGGALNLSSTKLFRPWSPWESSHSRKNPQGGTWNRTQDLMISSQKVWPLDHELTGLYSNVCITDFPRWNGGGGGRQKYPKIIKELLLQMLNLSFGQLYWHK